MGLNCIHVSHMIDVQKLVFLGSGCIYPKFAKQPMSEDQLLTGALEPTNEWYAIAKIAGIKLCEAYRREYSRDFVSVMPTNLYGPVDDFADACVFVLKNYSDVQFVNIGFGEDITIAELARLVAEIVGFRGEIVYDTSKPRKEIHAVACPCPRRPLSIALLSFAS